MSLEAEVVLRFHKPEDMNCISDNWGKSYYRGSSAYRHFTPETFHSFHRPIRERFFLKENTTLLVASWNSDPWLILGWIAFESLPEATLLHYIYIKNSLKQEGIANLLMRIALPMRPVIFTHLTEKAEKIMRQKKERFKDFIYIPNLV